MAAAAESLQSNVELVLGEDVALAEAVARLHGGAIVAGDEDGAVTLSLTLGGHAGEPAEAA